MLRRPLIILLCCLPASGCIKRSADPKIAVTPSEHPTSLPAVGPALKSSPLMFGVVTPNIKVRPTWWPKALVQQVDLLAARNEFEAFQLVLVAKKDTVDKISVLLSKPLSGPSEIPAKNIRLYRVAYYEVKTPSNREGAAGRWPDALIPDVDPYVGEKRNAFPFSAPAGESRVVWVDLLVPQNAKPGDYRGELTIAVAGRAAGTVAIKLRVGNFTLPSTASLRSAFGMDFAQPCLAHSGNNSCSEKWNEDAAYQLRERYVRAALEHRFTISDLFFQPPPETAPAFKRHMLPLINGTGKTRLPGAKVTAVEIDARGKEISKWIDFARTEGFADRLLYFPIDEPGDDDKAWAEFRREAALLDRIGPNVSAILTAGIDAANRFKATPYVDIFVPIIEQIEDRPPGRFRGPDYRRDRYDDWLKGDKRRELWSYQSCMSHGCGECGAPSPDARDTGWPNRVIDTSAVQNRAFPWLAFRYRFSGELYFAATEQLTTAWDKDGQCKFSGSGDGTIVYPGTPARIGGRTHIPVTSIRMKMIREGMEDYEYLRLAAQRDRARTEAIAKALFPRTYQCAKPPEELENARRQLFALIAGVPAAAHPSSTAAH